ncbi:TonB-dependent receptor [Glaciecola sp. XM2]|uniref:TonB-dependent receptor plug domain-containing protein n=1 Tax=Glaciecola sp. XM2 TaxID=1914931 RepID=UPI0020321950|nr:TonB-dependent receptor [Glaciecola sp. XM2]
MADEKDKNVQHSDKAEHKDEHDHHDEEHGHGAERILVQATRLGRIVNDAPIRVELINREEIQEKAVMRPGNISMLVAETGGVRVQTTSPALGSANIRLQGLYGRYTQLLSDGLPLYGSQAPSIGLLQIPPTDLAHVEIIKGSASSLYGGAALGGVINLISRQPGDQLEGEALLNLTSRDGQDFTTYIAAPLDDRFSGSITAGAHHQSEQDFDNDGWIDMAGYERLTARPRLFFNGENGETLYATVGVMSEQRTGGTRSALTLPSGAPFAQNQDTQRVDAGLVFNRPVKDTLNLNVRASAMVQDHDHLFGTLEENDTHESYLLESSIAGYSQQTDWVVGLAFQSDTYDSDTFPAFNYQYDVPGIFSQVDYTINDTLLTSVSARLDDHSEYGTQFNPRVSLLYRPGEWTVRGSYGRGYFASSPFVEEIEEAGLSRLAPLQNLQEERAQTASIDIGYSSDSIQTSLTLFGSNVDGVTELTPFSSLNNGVLDRVRLVNALEETRIRGSELLMRYYWNDFKFTGSYLYIDSSQQSVNDIVRSEIALTPRHSAGFVAMWEQHGNGRVGFEAYYTGTQQLENNPYRDRSDAYWHLGLMAEITLGKISYFINFENLLDIRQTKEDSLLLPARGPSGRWTTDIWSRNDGFIVNAGIRVQFDGH